MSDQWCSFWSKVDETFQSLPSFGIQVKMNYIINFFKGGTFPYCFLLMYVYDHWTFTSVLYSILHGSYGICWILKDVLFADKNFSRDIGLSYSICSSFYLAMYWYGFFHLCSNQVEQPFYFLIMAGVLYNLGAFFMFCSDCQKYFTLKYKKGLIDDGFFYYSRNTNYLGEIMIYASFGILASSGIYWCWLLHVWTCLFAKNMWHKEKSLKKKKGAEVYYRRSSILIPGLW